MVGNGDPAGPAGQDDDSNKPTLMQTLLKAFILYMSFRFFTEQWKGAKDHGPRSAVESFEAAQQEGKIGSSSSTEAINSMFGIPPAVKIPTFPNVDASGRAIQGHACTFTPGTRMQLRVYLSPEDTPLQSEPEPDRLVWTEEGLVFDTRDENSRRASLRVPVDEHMARNGSVWAHVILAKEGAVLWPGEEGYESSSVEQLAHQMNVHRRKPKAKDVRSLLSSKGDAKSGSKPEGQLEVADGTAPSEPEVVNYWKPALTLNLVDASMSFKRNRIPDQFAQSMNFHQATGNYYPIVYENEFWLQAKHYIPLNDTLQEVPLEVIWAPISIIKWQLMSQMERQWAQQSAMGLASDGDNDVMREMLGETAPWLLAVTFVVSVLHSVFDFLAFKNDVSFWRKNKSLEGLSLRTMVVSCFFQLVIMLYLLDNDTSFMILASTGIGVVIEMWKIGKAFNSSLDWSGPIPKLSVKAKETYSKSNTKVYDAIATSHLLFLVLPLICGYSVYSLLHREHKSWYSWILNSLVGFVYMFGFINMTPQLYINYRLKSVAHLPWKAMVYKSLNTFVDDLFSFIIKMPTMHRLACFRDDFIFFIYLYQRWIYPIDKARVNEYGQGVSKHPDDLSPPNEAHLANRGGLSMCRVPMTKGG
jgi:hypothetical protein